MGENLRFKRELLGVSILLLLGSLLIVYPFLDAIILAVATSYLLRFAHRRINGRLHNEFLSSVIVVTSIIGIVIISLYLFTSNFDVILESLESLLVNVRTNIDNIITTLDLSPDFRTQVRNFISNFSETVKQNLRVTLASIPSLLIDVAIYLVTAIYLYKDGGKLEDKVMKVVKSLPENEEKIVRSLIRSTDSIFKGVFVTQFLVAVVLTVVSAAGFYAISYFTSSIPLIPLWSIMIGIAALLPLVAAFMFYGPLGGYYLLFGEPLKGALILVFGAVVINVMTEVFLRPYIGSKQMNEHPLIIFTGFLAGPLTLGIKGLVLGPVMLILSKEFLLNYSELVGDEDE